LVGKANKRSKTKEKEKKKGRNKKKKKDPPNKYLYIFCVLGQILVLLKFGMISLIFERFDYGKPK
jgi:hypothetical protein